MYKDVNVSIADNDAEFWASFEQVQSLMTEKKLTSPGEVITILLVQKLCKYIIQSRKQYYD